MALLYLLTHCMFLQPQYWPQQNQWTLTQHISPNLNLIKWVRKKKGKQSLQMCVVHIKASFCIHVVWVVEKRAHYVSLCGETIHIHASTTTPTLHMPHTRFLSRPKCHSAEDEGSQRRVTDFIMIPQWINYTLTCSLQLNKRWWKRAPLLQGLLGVAVS